MRYKLFRKIRRNKKILISSFAILILFFRLNADKVDKVLYVTNVTNSEKWLISYNLEDAASIQLCKLHPTWNILCIQSAGIKYNFIRRFPDCEKHILWNFYVKNTQLEALHTILKLGAKYIKIHNPEQHVNLSNLDVVLHNEFEHSLYLNFPKAFEKCGKDSYSLPFCKFSRAQLAFVPVPYISCSKDILVATGSLENNFYIDFSTSILTSDAAWILFFMEKYQSLKNNEKILLSCLALEIGRLQRNKIKFFLSPFETKLLEIIKCDKHASLFVEAIRELSSLTLINTYIKEELIKILLHSFPSIDSSSLSHWFQTLLYNGYTFIDSLDFLVANTPFNIYNTLHNECNAELFYPRIGDIEHHRTYENEDQIKLTHKKICANFSSIELHSKPKVIYSDITLIIIFNYPHYEVIPLLEIMYRASFPTIIYCGFEAIDTNFYKDLLNYKISFVMFDDVHKNVKTHRFDAAVLSSGCVTKMIEMNLNTRGYLVISDDVVINNINLQDLDRDVPWFPEHTLKGVYDFITGKKCIKNQCIYHSEWRWFDEYRNECIRLLDELSSLSQNSSFFYEFHSIIVNLTGGSRRLFGGYGDIYYIPQNLSIQFYRIANLFNKHGIFFEITIPNIFMYFQYAHKTMIKLEGSVQWDGIKRYLPWLHLTEEKMKDKHFHHPFKLKKLSLMKTKHISSFDSSIEKKLNATEELLKELFCTKVVPFLINGDRLG